MKAFAELITAIDQTTSTNAKVAALEHYLLHADDSDKIWAVALLAGRRPKRTVNASLLGAWATEAAGISDWLFNECYHIVGDLAETIALLLPEPQREDQRTLADYMDMINSLAKLAEEERKEQVLHAWAGLDNNGRFLFNKLITGNFRIGVSAQLVTRAISHASQMDEPAVAHRLMGNWSPQTTTYDQLLGAGNDGDDLSRPYPFYLAYPIDVPVNELGPVQEWQAEFKWDGIRGQLIKRKGEIYIWSRGEELVTDKFPELRKVAEALPDGVVIDGEIIGLEKGCPLPFHALQTRIGRKNITASVLKSCPTGMICYDLLEHDGQDLRPLPLSQRRALLEGIISNINQPEILAISEVVQAASWEELTEIRAESRAALAEGLMLKRLDSPYETGRRKGNWWKWKVDPLSIDAVMIYAQRGHGRRANLYTDFTFAVWSEEGTLVPFAKAYSGLTDKEMAQVDAFVKKHTLEKFGPVRSVTPELVFEIGFEGINPSPRHKSGIALRFPRILRWRTDKKPEEANTLADLQAILKQYGSRSLS